MHTAGRTVAFSAFTVAISISGLLCSEPIDPACVRRRRRGVIVVARSRRSRWSRHCSRVAGRRLRQAGLAGPVPGLRWVIRRTGDVTAEEGTFSRLASGSSAARGS